LAPALKFLLAGITVADLGLGDLELRYETANRKHSEVAGLARVYRAEVRVLSGMREVLRQVVVAGINPPRNGVRELDGFATSLLSRQMIGRPFHGPNPRLPRLR
jgi:hypothetical protein